MLPVYYNMSAIEVISDITNLRLTESARSTIPNTYFGNSKNYEKDPFFFATALISILFFPSVALLFLCGFIDLVRVYLDIFYSMNSPSILLYMFLFGSQ